MCAFGECACVMCVFERAGVFCLWCLFVCACVCDVFKRVWFDCDLLCDGVWSVVCVGLCVRVGVCACVVCVFEGVGVFCLWCLIVCV